MGSATAVPLAAAGVGDVLQIAFRLFRATLLRSLPWSLLAVLVGHLPALAAPHTAFALSLTLLAGLINLWFWLLIALRQCNDQPLAADILQAVHLLPRALGVIAASLVIVLLGAVALLLPGVYLAVACWPAFAVLVLEQSGVRASIDRSVQLVRGHWWHTTACLLVGLFLIFGFFVLGGLAGFALGDRLPSVLVTSLLAAFFQPLVAALGISQVRALVARHNDSSASNSL